MNRNERIEEMAVILTDGGCVDCAECSFNNRFNCKPMYDAELLYRAGYRKASEVAREIITKAITALGKIITEHIEGDNGLIEVEIDICNALWELEQKYTEVRTDDN